jgi:hypothetical protein
MRYLENHYRKNNIYTEYHRQIENQPLQEARVEEIEPIFATLVEPSAPTDIYRAINK